MDRESRAADVDRFLGLPCTTALFRELCKRNRRRILLDPASEIVDPLAVRHLLLDSHLTASASLPVLAVDDVNDHRSRT